MRAVCPSASVQLPPAAVTVDLGSAQYCKKFYFFVYFIAVSTGFNFLRNKGSEATCSRRVSSAVCVRRLSYPTPGTGASVRETPALTPELRFARCKPAHMPPPSPRSAACT